MIKLSKVKPVNRVQTPSVEEKNRIVTCKIELGEGNRRIKMDRDKKEEQCLYFSHKSTTSVSGSEDNSRVKRRKVGNTLYREE